jgi:hypothetical protein
MKIVLAFGTSNPLSIMVVATKHQIRRSWRQHHQFLEFLSVHLSVTNTYSSIGHQTLNHSRYFLNVFDAVIDEKTCPFRCISYEIASRITSSLKPTTFVSIGYRLGGGVVITDKSRALVKTAMFLELALLLKLTYRHLRQSFSVCLYITVFVPHLQSIIQGLWKPFLLTNWFQSQYRVYLR